MKLPSLTLALLLVALTSASANAQGGATSSITGVVADSGGGVLPGATVVITSNATGTQYEAVANASGAYSVPALSAGLYTVTVTLQGFRTSVINDVRVQLGIRRRSMRRSTWASWPRRSRSAARARN